MTQTDLKTKLLEAAKPHVPFDGWSAATFDAAVADCGADPTLARAVCPRGAVDLALAYHAAGDAEMLARLAATELAELRFRDRIALAVRYRLEAADRELVRRGSALFALPQYATDGARVIWGTADHIWLALGDTSDDFNWYSKRATLSAVYASTVLFWLGDESPEHAETWAFLDRRIDDVMQFEKLKAQVRDNKALSALMAGPLALLNRVKPPAAGYQSGMPGRWGGSK